MRISAQICNTLADERKNVSDEDMTYLIHLIIDGEGSEFFLENHMVPVL